MAWKARPRFIEAIEKGDISEVVDPRLEKHYIEGEVYRMIETAASCVRHSALKRPRMVQVRIKLNPGCLPTDAKIKPLTDAECLLFTLQTGCKSSGHERRHVGSVKWSQSRSKYGL